MILQSIRILLRSKHQLLVYPVQPPFLAPVEEGPVEDENDAGFGLKELVVDERQQVAEGLARGAYILRRWVLLLADDG